MPLHIENQPDFTPGDWISLSEPELENASLNLQASWYAYLNQRVDGFTRGHLTASETKERFEAPLGKLKDALEVFRGSAIEGTYNRPYFFNLSPDAPMPRRVNFLGSGGFAYAKEFRGVLGGIIATDVRWDKEDDVQPSLIPEVESDYLLLAVGPEELSGTDRRRSFPTRKDALMYRDPFGILKYAGDIACLQLESVVQLGVNRGERVDFAQPEE